MTDHKAFLAAICAEPANITPRLVYADWLEEQGDDEGKLLSEFIRVQIELSRIEDECIPGADRDKVLLLTKREAELLTDQANRGAYGLSLALSDGGKITLSDVGMSFNLRRGFMEEITCAWAHWLEHHERLRNGAPIRQVTLTTEPELMVETRTSSYTVSSRREPPMVRQGPVSFVAQSPENPRLEPFMSDMPTPRAMLAIGFCAHNWPGIEFNVGWEIGMESVPANREALDFAGMVEQMRDDVIAGFGVPRETLEGDRSVPPGGVINARRSRRRRS